MCAPVCGTDGGRRVAFHFSVIRSDSITSISCCLRRYLIQVAHVALVPGDAFGAPQCVRISYAASMETLKAAMERLQRALDPTVFTRIQAG